MKKHFKISFPAILFLTFLTQHILAQDYDKSIVEQITPVEPTASSLGKYGVYPVNFSTGLVPITIPLYQIKSGELTQTIELSYHGGGIRVKDEASWVGLGWDLNIGGGITVSVNGFPDEFESETVPVASEIHQDLSLPDAWTLVNGFYKPLSQANTCDKSFKPDLYYYNYGTYFGTFFLKGGKPISIAHSAIDGTVSNNNIMMNAPNGDTYYFDATDNTVFHGVSSRQTTYNSNFGISKIISLNNTDSIMYDYQADGVYNSNNNTIYQGKKKILRTIFHCGQGSDNFSGLDFESIPITQTTISTQTVTSLKPHHIYFNDGRITFTISSRSDLQANYNTIKKLDNILIEKKVGQSYVLVRLITFNYTYFNLGQDFQTSRLKLNSVSEFEFATSQTRIIASFEYNEDENLPAKESYNIDYWGFYNGSNNSSPIPPTYFSNKQFGDADRFPNPYYAQTATLKNITYLTKGKTEFVWEGNKVYTETPPDEGQKKIEISLRGNPNLNHEIISPESEQWVSADLFTPVTQTATVYYYLYRNDIDVINLDHKKYDEGKFFLGVVDEDGSCTDMTELSPILNATKSLQTFQLPLTAGIKYRLFIYTNCYYVTASLDLEYNAYSPNINEYFYPVAGLRIKEIRNYDELGQYQFGKKYTYLDPSGKSSGYMTNNRRLSYERLSFSKTTEEWRECLYAIETTTCTANSTITSGLEPNSFGYEYVQEEDITNNQSNGKTTYKLNRAGDLFVSEEVPTISNSHLRSQVLLQTDYKYIDNINDPFSRIREIQNFYSEDSRVNEKRDGFILQSLLDFPSFESLSPWVPIITADLFNPMNYSFMSKWSHLDRTVTTEYITPTSTFVTDILNTYGNEKHLQPTEVLTYTSDRNQLLTKTKYSLDFDDKSFMTDKHMLIQPLEIKKYIKKGTSEPILTGGYNLTYTVDSYNHVNLSQVSEYLPDGTLDLLNTYSYNQRGRIIEAVGKDNIKTSIFWGYDGYHPLVIGKNISYSNLIPAIQSTTDLSLLYTKTACANALITTYTYNPLFGISSKTDPRGLKIFFNYDYFGRTTSILDNEQKILQSFKYHYKP